MRPFLWAINNTMSTLKNIIRIGDALNKRKLGRIEPQKAYMFEVDFLDHNSHVPSFGEIKYNVKTVNVPPRTKDVAPHNFMNSKINYAGKESSEKTVSITFWDNEGLTVLDFMTRWFGLSAEEHTHDAMPKREYIKDIRISLKDTNDLLTTSSFVLRNAFPSEIGEIPLSYDDSSVIEIPMTFAYDWMEFDDGFASTEERIAGIKESASGITKLFSRD